jgi:hypothetical protein
VRHLTGDHWIYVSLPHATFMLGVKNGTVTDAPPVARWAVDRAEREVAAFYRRKGARFVRLDQGGATADKSTVDPSVCGSEIE